MGNKYINWIKDNCWIIAGILLAGNIIYVYFLINITFIILKMYVILLPSIKIPIFLVGKKYPKIQYDFSYEVNRNKL